MPLVAVSSSPTPSTVDSYSLPSDSLVSSHDLRFDAAHYNPKFLEAIRILRESGMKLRSLAEVTKSVFMPTRFKRIYVDRSNGLPFLQGSHVVQFQPADVKYLSPTSYRNIEDLMIKTGWLLVTRSGTVGRVTICPEEWNGWVASEHILRIIPDENLCLGGYLCSFLACEFGQVQLNANVHGAVVDELTEDQLRNVLVPMPESESDMEFVRSINSRMNAGVAMKSRAVASVESSVDELMDRISSAPRR